MVTFNLTIGAVEPHYLSEYLVPGDDLDRVFFHPELPVYTDGSRDDKYRSGSGITSNLKNPEEKSRRLLGFSHRNAIKHLSNWQSVRDNVGVSILTKLKRLSTLHQIHLQWIPSHIDLEENEIVDTLAKAGARELPEPSTPLIFLEIFSRTKHQNKTTWITPPEHHWYQCSCPGGSLAHGFTRQDQTLLARFRSGHIKSMKFSEGRKSFEMCTNSLLTNGGVQQQQQIPEGSELANIVAKVTKLAVNLVAKNDANLAPPSKFRQVLIESPLQPEGVGRLHMIDGTLNDRKYNDTILEPKLLPSLRNLFTNNASFIFHDEAHFWLNGYVNKQNCRIWSEANPQVYVETPLHPEKLTVWGALWAGGILLQNR
ncbi:RNase H domain-containing protein [Trichonephila clavipes]|nr:RNase H domain-containing protein [Trichonephila clavipes]